MFRNKISSVNILEKTRVILRNDVDTLSKMSILREGKSEIREFILSLINAKSSLQRMLSGYARDQDHLSRSSLIVIPTYNTSSVDETQNTRKMIRIFKEIETDQFKYIKASMKEEGLAEESKNILKNVLFVYARILSQIDRAFKTQNLQEISI